jgi:hypothetical protein
VPAEVDGLADLAIEGFDGVGRVDDAPQVRRERRKRRDVFPVLTPGPADRGEALIPLLGDGELVGGGVLVDGGVDALEV